MVVPKYNYKRPFTIVLKGESNKKFKIDLNLKCDINCYFLK